MVRADSATHIERHITHSRFVLFIENTNNGSVITQMEVNNQDEVQGLPKVVNTQQVIDQLKSTTLSTEQKANYEGLIDHRVLVDNHSMKAWFYTPSKKQKLYFKHGAKKFADRFPFPTLLFKLNKTTGTLSVAALRYKCRPKLDSVIYHAPLPNVGSYGAVCLGNVVLNPDDPIEKISTDYLNSFKSHLNSASMFRNSESTNEIYYKWVRQVTKKKKMSLSDLSKIGTVQSFLGL
ncbi:hypothetical protein [Vibrio mediterranei]|uniref:hypothetical protein n=1 Tax=Vibrio mediterranei TaxID=689 RepID=UPI004067DA52